MPVAVCKSYNPGIAVTIPVWAFPASLATTTGITNCFLFLRVLRCFSSPGSPPTSRVVHLQCTGLPHSEICGSKLICSSPQLIAAYHVLHRLWEPRHPPYALINFLCALFQSLTSLLHHVKELFIRFDVNNPRWSMAHCHRIIHTG